MTQGRIDLIPGSSSVRSEESLCIDSQQICLTWQYYFFWGICHDDNGEVDAYPRVMRSASYYPHHYCPTYAHNSLCSIQHKRINVDDIRLHLINNENKLAKKTIRLKTIMVVFPTTQTADTQMEIVRIEK